MLAAVPDALEVRSPRDGWVTLNDHAELHEPSGFVLYYRREKRRWYVCTPPETGHPKGRMIRSSTTLHGARDHAARQNGFHDGY